jgi:transcriptional regulator with XRE-family HTH domain
MVICDRLSALREEKKLSQGDIEKRTGLLRCYISRVENGHTVPTVETLEKMARALGVPLYRLFYDGEAPPKLENLPKRKTADEIAGGSSGKDARYLSNLRGCWGALRNGTGSCCYLSHRNWLRSATDGSPSLPDSMSVTPCIPFVLLFLSTNTGSFCFGNNGCVRDGGFDAVLS